MMNILSLMTVVVVVVVVVVDEVGTGEERL